MKWPHSTAILPKTIDNNRPTDRRATGLSLQTALPSIKVAHRLTAMGINSKVPRPWGIDNHADPDQLSLQIGAGRPSRQWPEVPTERSETEPPSHLDWNQSNETAKLKNNNSQTTIITAYCFAVLRSAVGGDGGKVRLRNLVLKGRHLKARGAGSTKGGLSISWR